MRKHRNATKTSCCAQSVEGRSKGKRPRFLGSAENLGVDLPLGDNHLRLVVTDRIGESDAQEFLLILVDTTPPEIVVTMSPGVLWPPNHRLVPVHVTLALHDDCTPVTAELESILSSEPDNAPGTSDGNTTRDIQGAAFHTPDFDFLLRAERIFPGPGRLYRVTYRASDGSGNISRYRFGVVVPAIPEPVSNSTLDGPTGTFEPSESRR
jgi:hypothetical protein